MRYGYAFYIKRLYSEHKIVVCISILRPSFCLGHQPYRCNFVSRKITKRNFMRIVKPYMYRDDHVYFSQIHN